MTSPTVMDLSICRRVLVKMFNALRNSLTQVARRAIEQTANQNFGSCLQHPTPGKRIALLQLAGL